LCDVSFVNFNIKLVRRPEPLSKNLILRWQTSKSSNTIYYHLLEPTRRFVGHVQCHESGVKRAKVIRILYGYFVNVHIKLFRRPELLSKTESQDGGPQKVQTPFTIICLRLPGVLRAICHVMKVVFNRSKVMIML
jgi:hypothetical protein